MQCSDVEVWNLQLARQAAQKTSEPGKLSRRAATGAGGAGDDAWIPERCSETKGESCWGGREKKEVTPPLIAGKNGLEALNARGIKAVLMSFECVTSKPGRVSEKEEFREKGSNVNAKFTVKVYEVNKKKTKKQNQTLQTRLASKMDADVASELFLGGIRSLKKERLFIKIYSDHRINP